MEYLMKGQIHGLMEQNEEPRNRFTKPSQLILGIDAKLSQQRKTLWSFQQKVLEQLDVHIKKSEPDLNIKPIQKLTQNRVIDIIVKYKTIKFL